MPDIFHSLVINAAASNVFSGITTEHGINNWWTLRSRILNEPNMCYILDFGPAYIWQAAVTGFKQNQLFALQMTKADNDWQHTKLQFELQQNDNGSAKLIFSHLGWSEANDHFYTSSYCWAMYLRLLKLYVEKGYTVPYINRLEV